MVAVIADVDVSLVIDVDATDVALELTVATALAAEPESSAPLWSKTTIMPSRALTTYTLCVSGWTAIWRGAIRCPCPNCEMNVPVVVNFCTREPSVV